MTVDVAIPLSIFTSIGKCCEVKMNKYYLEKHKVDLENIKEYAKEHGYVEVPDFPEYYADIYGNIYSTRKNGGYRRKPELMTGTPDKDGYLRLNFYHKGKRKSQIVHRVIAKTFIDNPLNLPQVNHIDGDKTNNAVSNLEWCTCADNLKHSFECLGRKNVGTPKPIVVTDTVTGERFVFESIRTCAKYLGVDKGYLNSLLTGRHDKEYFEKTRGCSIEYFDVYVDRLH